MFESLLQHLVRGSHGIKERAEGIAFLRAAKSAYPIATICYVALNVPLRAQASCFVQCTLADAWAKHCVSKEKLHFEKSGVLARAFREPLDWSSLPEDATAQTLWQFAGADSAGHQVLSLPLRPLADEAAFLCIDAEAPLDEWKELAPTVQQEFQILGNYFHQHMLRIYGHDASSQMLISARELDCLKWMAQGKTAWEASVILGISERTVRFHLNAAREKLDCLTTTQAVAKAVSRQLISP